MTRKLTHPSPRRAETRQKILDAAGRLFRAHGIDGVGVDAVMKEAGLTHGGFYLHFPSKEALAAEVARALLQNAADRWQAVSDRDPPDVALRSIVEFYLNPTRAAAAACCPLTTLGPDVARRPQSRNAVGAALRGMLEALRHCLPGHRPDTAMVTLSTMVGAVVLSRLADDPATAQAFLNTARDAILAVNGSASGSE